jgi:AcrR family transcriptional regulator
MAETGLGRLSKMKEPSRNSDSDNSARDRIVEAAFRAIDSGGEAAVRISTVARDAGVTQGMISYYFGGREGLIQEAQLLRFSSTVTDDIKALEKKARECTEVEDLRDFLSAATAQIVSLNRASARAARLMTIGAALPRPDLLEVISEAQSILIDEMEKVILIGQARDLVRKDLDPRALAVFILAYNTGLVVADIDQNRPADEKIAAVIGRFVDSFLNIP